MSSSHVKQQFPPREVSITEYLPRQRNKGKYRHPKIAQQLLELRQQKRSKVTEGDDNTVVALTAAPSNIDHANRLV